MKNYLKSLRHSLLPTSGGLIFGCMLTGLIMALVIEIMQGTALQLKTLETAAILGLMSMCFGLLPAFLWGSPLYALAQFKNKATYLSAILIGAIPGLLLLPQQTGWGQMCLYFGVGIGICTHFFAKRTHFYRSSLTPHLFG